MLGSDALPLRLQGGVNVDEGSEVVYRGEVYTVQDCDGFDAEIKNRLRTITVRREAQRGVEHTNSWNNAKNTDPK